MIGRALIVIGMTLASTIAPGRMTITRADPAGDLAAARQLQAQERWAASESLATAALTSLEQAGAPDSLAIAEALHWIGVAKWKRVGYADGAGLLAAARSLAIRERRLGADHLEVAAAHSLLGRFLLGTDRADSALVHVRRAIAIREARLAPDDTLIAKVWDQLALIHRDRRDFHAALEAWGRAIEIRKRAHGPEHPEVARLLAQTGVPWMELGDLERARQVLEGALGIFERTAGRDHPGRWIPLNILADVEKRSGNLARDMDLLQEALRVVRLAYGENAREALALRHNLAIGLAEFGDYAGAKAMHGNLLPLMVSQYGPSHPRTLLVRQGLAQWSVQTGDTATALRELLEIESILAAREGPPARDLSATRALQATILLRQGRPLEARAMSERAIATERATRQPAGGTLAGAQEGLMLVLETIGDTAALERARVELARIDKTYALASQSAGPHARYFCARAARRLGRRDEAWALALEADQLSHERLRLNLQILPDRRGLQYAREQELYLELVLDVCRGADGRDRATAWDRLVRARGLVRAELARRRLPQGFESDTAVTGAHGRWIEAQRRLAQRMVSASVSTGDSLALAALERLRTAAEEAESAYARVLGNHGATFPPSEVGLADVRSRLRAGQALVAFVESREYRPGWTREDTSAVLAFVARGGVEAVELVELGRSAILRAALDPWRQRLGASPGPRSIPGNRAERESRRLGREVRDLTWDRIAPHLAGAADVFLVPDGPLLDLPWQALPVGANGYLVEEGPRLHILNAERELVEPALLAGSRSLLAMGAPDFDRGPTRASGAALLSAAVVRSAPDPCAAGRLSSLGPLPESGTEAVAVARAWRADPSHEAMVLTGLAASEQTFKREARGRAVIHLATHGVVAADTCAASSDRLRGVGGVEPLAAAGRRHRADRPPAPKTSPAATASPWMARRVWLALAGANRSEEHASDENEGFLTAEEVVTLDLAGTDWVVLSACHSGLAEAWSREGTLGMRRAFDLAGARTVIASQWAVEDEAAREWMQALYTARAAGATTAAAALESASRAVLAERRSQGRSTHPFYWAAFSSSGE